MGHTFLVDVQWDIQDFYVKNVPKVMPKQQDYIRVQDVETKILSIILSLFPKLG